MRQEQIFGFGAVWKVILSPLAPPRRGAKNPVLTAETFKMLRSATAGLSMTGDMNRSFSNNAPLFDKKKIKRYSFYQKKGRGQRKK